MAIETEETVGMTWEQAAREAEQELSETEETKPEQEAALEPGEVDDTESAAEGSDSEAGDQDAIEEAADTQEKALTDEDFEELRKTSPKMAALVDNLLGWRKELTQESQANAASKKELEELRAFAPWIQSFQKDPQGTLLKLAEVAEVDLAGGSKSAQPIPSIEDEAVALLKESLEDPDLEILADRMGKPMVQVARKIAESIVDEKLRPFQENHRISQTREVEGRIKQAITDLSKNYPNWKQLEPQMLEIAQGFLFDQNGQYKPPNMSEYDFFETLYAKAVLKKGEAAKAREQIRRTNAARKKSESPRGGVSPENVKKELPQGAGFWDCAREAEAELAEQFEEIP